MYCCHLLCWHCVTGVWPHRRVHHPWLGTQQVKRQDSLQKALLGDASFLDGTAESLVRYAEHQKTFYCRIIYLTKSLLEKTMFRVGIYSWQLSKRHPDGGWRERARGLRRGVGCGKVGRKDREPEDPERPCQMNWEKNTATYGMGQLALLNKCKFNKGFKNQQQWC